MQPRRGWVFVDVLMGLMLVGIIASMLGAAANWHYRALKHLADLRAATRIAESALVSLQAGESGGAGKCAVRELPTGGDSPSMQWVEVSATVDGRSASLVGLAPKTATPGGSP